MKDIQNTFYKSTADIESIIIFFFKKGFFNVFKANYKLVILCSYDGLWHTKCQEMFCICQEALSWIL